MDEPTIIDHEPITDEDIKKNLYRAASYRVYSAEEEEEHALREQFSAVMEHQEYFMRLFEAMGNNPVGVGPEDFVARFGRTKMANADKFKNVFDGGVIAFQRYGLAGSGGKIIPIALIPRAWRFNQWPACNALIKLANDYEIARIRSSNN